MIIFGGRDGEFNCLNDILEYSLKEEPKKDEKQEDVISEKVKNVKKLDVTIRTTQKKKRKKTVKPKLNELVISISNNLILLSLNQLNQHQLIFLHQKSLMN